VSKAELLTDGERGEIRKDHPDWDMISALTGDGIDDLMYEVADRVSEIVHTTPEREGYTLHRPLREAFTVRRDSGQWVVEGITAVRAVNLSDLTDPDAAEFASRRLERSGIVRALVEAGAEAGDDVRIGSIVFTFDPQGDAFEEEYQ